MSAALSHALSSGQKRRRVLWALLALLLLLILGAGIGSVAISPQQILAILAGKLFGRPLNEGTPEVLVSIFWSVRLPRVLTAFLVGAALSASGVVMQSVLQNPLASSYTLGVSSGASLGAALVLLLGFGGGLGTIASPVFGFVFGMGTVFLVLGIARKIDAKLENTTIILIGMVTAQFFGGILTILMTLARETMERLVVWQMGSFSGSGGEEVLTVFIVLVAGATLLFRFHRELDIMTFGEHQARAIGVDLSFVKPFVLIIAALLTGAAISLSGVIGFVDLIAPHLARRLFGSSHKIVLPMSMVLGGSIMVLADLVSRTILAPRELPVGAITALIGAPFFAYVYFRRRKERSIE